MSEISREIEYKFRNKSKRSTIISLVGAVITIGGLLFTTYGAIIQARKAETEARISLQKAQEAVYQAKIAEEERMVAERLLEQLKRQEEAEKLVWSGAEMASRGMITDAISTYESAIKLNPQNATAYQLRGYALLRRAQISNKENTSDLADGIASLEKSISIDQQQTWGYYNLSLAYWEAGRRDDAVNSLRSLLSIDPSFKSIISNDVQFKKFQSSKEFLSLMRDG